MANRRMFSLDIVGSDAFLDMPSSSQALYFHLGMYADDDGFVTPKKIMRMTGAVDDDLKILIGKRFILTFENGVIVIKHWKVNNYIQTDRYKMTKYLEEKSKITEKENGSYTECIQNVYRLETQVRLGKVRLGKVNNKRIIKENIFNFTEDEIKELKKKLDYLTIKEILEEIITAKDWLASTGKEYKDYKAFMRNWLRRSNNNRKEKYVEPFNQSSIRRESHGNGWQRAV